MSDDRRDDTSDDPSDDPNDDASEDVHGEAGDATTGGGDGMPASDLAPFDAVRASLTGSPELSLGQVAEAAGLPLRILQELFRAMQWDDRDGYDERDVAYARDVAKLLDYYPLDTVVRSLGTRYRALSSIVVSDLGTVRDEVVEPALAGGADPEQLAAALGRAADDLLPLVTGHLDEDYRHIVLNLLDSDALARGVEGGQEIDLAVGFVDVAGYTALSGRIDPTGLDHVLSRFEDLVHAAVTRHDDVLLAKFIGDAAMLVASDPLTLTRVLLGLVHDRDHLAEAPRKAGVAFGPVLVRQGDYYGATPNLAARLTDHARPWTLLAANDLRERLEGEFDVTTVPETSLRGVGDHRPLRIRPSEDPDDR